MVQEKLPPGSAKLQLVADIRLLHEEESVLDAMLAGWDQQMRGGRRVRKKTAVRNCNVVKRFVQHVNEYPWNWTAGMVDEWMTSLTSERSLATSTIRQYQGTLRIFCDYLTSPHYDWPEQCLQRFGTHPVQVCHEWNTTAHLTDYEGNPGRRPLTRRELQAFFDYADDQVELAASSRKKGALSAYRDATLFKVIYGWGLRSNEALMLDNADLHRNASAPEFGKYGMLHVRWGKASRGSAPKRRMVLSLMPWAVAALRDYVENIRPLWSAHDHPGLWVTERNGRLRARELEERFAMYRDDLGFPDAITLHCLRHSYVTHLIEDGVDPKFVQTQVGHRFQSTTAIYTSVSGDFMNKMMRKALDRAFDGEESADVEQA